MRLVNHSCRSLLFSAYFSVLVFLQHRLNGSLRAGFWCLGMKIRPCPIPQAGFLFRFKNSIPRYYKDIHIYSITIIRCLTKRYVRRLAVSRTLSLFRHHLQSSPLPQKYPRDLPGFGGWHPRAAEDGPMVLGDGAGTVRCRFIISRI